MVSRLLRQIQDLILQYGTGDSLPSQLLPFLYISCFDSQDSSLFHIAEPTVSIMIQGSKQIFFGKNIIEYKTGEAFINSVDLPLSVRMTKISKRKPLLAIGIKLDPIIMSSLILEIDSKKYSSNVVGSKVATASEELLDAVYRLLKLLKHPEDLPVLRESLEREIHWRILRSDLGVVAYQFGQSENFSIRILKAIKWIRENYNEVLHVSHLANLSAMSKTSFHRHFRRITYMSPVQYHKKIRLQEARMRLLSRNDNVSSIAFEVGYESLSQFSREYRREFGVSPKNDSQVYKVKR